MNKPKSDNGFTLVELLTVIVVLSIMASMVLVAMNAATRSAKEARTRSIITAVETVLLEQYDSYKYRPLPLSIPDLSRQIETPPGSMTYVTVNHEVLAYEAARARLIMRRDLQRMEMPDKVADVVSAGGTILGPVNFTAVANRILEDPSGNVLRYFNDPANPRFQFAVSPAGSRRLQTYYDRYLSNASTWSSQNESSECLYLIMATSQYAGQPAIDSIPTNSIGDTDGDGMLEILDGWGTPLGFVRWPVGYADPSGTLQTNVPDDFDPFRVDFGFVVDSVTPPWSMRPLVVSAGADKLFGVASSNGFDYTTQTWPLTEMDTTGNSVSSNESDGRSGTYNFPDPYLRHASATPLPGGTTSTVDISDDITNYTIKVSQQ